MLNTELINLYNNMVALDNNFAISLIIPPTPILFTLFAPTVFNKYKNLLLKILRLATGSHVITDNVFII